MRAPNLPNTELTGEVAAPGATHIGAPHDIASICPSLPVVIPMVFPTRERPLVKVKRSEKSPVELLYEIAPVAESDERETFELNVFQSATERAPVVVVLAIFIPNTPVELS